MNVYGVNIFNVVYNDVIIFIILYDFYFVFFLF